MSSGGPSRRSPTLRVGPRPPRRGKTSLQGSCLAVQARGDPHPHAVSLPSATFFRLPRSRRSESGRLTTRQPAAISGASATAAVLRNVAEGAPSAAGTTRVLAIFDLSMSRPKYEPLTALDFDRAFPNSRRVHVKGPGGVKVPVREIVLSKGEPPLAVYDTSGPRHVDVHVGLPAVRLDWIRERKDVEDVGRGTRRPVLRAKSGQAVTQLALRAARRRHAGDGVHRDPRRAAGRVRAGRSRARPRHHSRQRQSPGARADDHRPQFPGEDQREHRQLGRRRRRSSRKWTSCGGRRSGAPTR